MVIYKCDICDYNTNRKSNYKNHKNRKKPCIVTTLNNTSSTPKTPTQKVNIPTNYNITEHIANTQNIKVNYMCNYCNINFSRGWTLSRHIQNTCKIKKQVENAKEERFNLLLIELKELKEEMKSLKSNQVNTTNIIKNNTNINNIQNNNTNNNIQNNIHIKLVPYGKENIDMISKPEWYKIFNRNYKSIEDLTNLLHFNKNNPQNHNIYIPNIKSKFIMIYDGVDWKLQDKRDVLEDLYETKAYIIFDKIDELKSNLSFYVVDKFNKIKKDYDSAKIKVVLLRDIELLLYNKKRIPIMTKKKLDLELIDSNHTNN